MRAHALIAKGATSVEVLATHGVLSDGALATLEEAPVDEVVVTDSIPLGKEMADSPKVTQVSVAPLIAEAIVRVHEGRSVSALFR